MPNANSGLSVLLHSTPTWVGSLANALGGTTQYDLGAYSGSNATLSVPGVFSPATSTYSSVAGKSPVDDWYGRIIRGVSLTGLGTELTIDAGALQSPEAYDFYVWNGKSSSVTITSITPSNAAGVDYSTSSDLISGVWTDSSGNSVIPALTTRKYTITISPTGDRSELDGTLTWLFSDSFSFVLPVYATEFGTWLAYDAAQRCLLVEAIYYQSGQQTVYLSNLGYISGSTMTPANMGYDEVLAGQIEVRSRIDGDLVVGSIDVDNTDGSFDDWVTRAWEGWPITVYLGDITWPRDAFKLVATGNIEALESPSPNTLSFRIRDKRKMLDVPVLTTRLGSGELRPVCLGTCFNVPAVWSTGDTYYVHDNAQIYDVTAMRDNGAVATFTENLSAGSVTKITNPVAGNITCDVIGATLGTAASMIDWLARRAGLGDADIDSANLAAFPNNATLGLYVSDDRTILQCMNEIMESVGGSWRFSREGKLQIFRLDAPTGDPVLSLTEDDVESFSLVIDSVEPPLYSVTIGYQRNWKVQDAGSIAGSVTTANRDLYSRQYSSVKVTSGSVRTSYPLAEDPPLTGTLIYAQADATTEANRRLTLRGTKRAIYRARCYALPFSIGLGDVIRIKYPRFGFDDGDGVLATVIGLREQPTIDRVELELWR